MRQQGNFEYGAFGCRARLLGLRNEAFQFLYVNLVGAELYGDQRLSFGDDAREIRGERGTPEFEQEVLDLPLRGAYARFSGQRGARFRAGLESEPARELAGMRRGKFKRDVRAAIVRRASSVTSGSDG